MYPRVLQQSIKDHLDHKKAILIKGARQVGKTTLVEELLKGQQILWLDGDDLTLRTTLNGISKQNLLQFIGNAETIVIDEAQRIPEIGIFIKIILDAKLGKQVFVLGSSSLSLNSSLNEPLTGRKWTFELFPLSWEEIAFEESLMNALTRRDELLVFGTYPEVFTSQKKQKLLKEITQSYLYKDILELADIRKPEIIHRLLQALAYQIGSEVSYNELANLLKIDAATVVRYIDLLEESFVLFRLPPLSTNNRKEITTSRKIYFYDTGVRNAVINNFNPLPLRNDHGQLWENFIIAEYKKKLSYHRPDALMYFWRAKTGAEVDLVIEENKTYEAVEIKYNPAKKLRVAASFTETYLPTSVTLINTENFWNYL